MLASDNQHILDAFQQGNVQGITEPGVTPEHIKTWISHVFLFPKHVYKIYQHENEGFNKEYRDLHTPASREWFYGEDFFWNHYFAPDVYEELLGIKADESDVRIVGKGETPDDLVIKMRRIDTSHNLTKRLPVDDLTIAIDNHSDNVFCDNGKASFLDIYQVKENWLLVEPMLNIYRLSADIVVLAGKEMQDALIQGYKDYYKLTDIDEKKAVFYTIYGALIKGAYNYILDKTEEAKPYFNYINSAQLTLSR